MSFTRASTLQLQSSLALAAPLQWVTSYPNGAHSPLLPSLASSSLNPLCPHFLYPSRLSTLVCTPHVSRKSHTYPSPRAHPPKTLATAAKAQCHHVQVKHSLILCFHAYRTTAIRCAAVIKVLPPAHPVLGHAYSISSLYHTYQTCTYVFCENGIFKLWPFSASYI